MDLENNNNIKKPKRILIFALTYLPFIGGAEVALKEITDRLDSAEYEFDLITLRFDSKLARVEKIGSITIYRIGFGTTEPSMKDLSRFPLQLNKYLFPVLAWYKALRLHSQKKYDAIWSMMANYAGFAALFFKLWDPAVPFLLSLQEGDPIEHIKKRVSHVYPLFRKIFLKADLIQVISTYLADFAKSMGYGKDPIVVPNGVDSALFSRALSDTDVDALNKTIGKKKNEVVITTVSRLVPKNAVEDLVRAMQLLPQNYRLLVLGSGPDEWKTKLLAIDLKVSERVMFIGHVHHRDIPLYMKISDVFVRPSVSEGMGNSFIEAMAAGVPVIATPVGGIVDFLFDPDKNPGKEPTGLFCDVHDPESIARQVQHIMHNTELRQRLIANAGKLVREHYDWNSIAADMRTKVFGSLFK